MSHYTKALEKIQNQRDEEVKPEKIAKAKKPVVLEIPPQLENSSPYWEHAVRQIRSAKPDSRVVNYHYPNSHIAEQYRMLRTNLKASLAKHNAKVIIVSSSVQGEGKTVTSVNLALSLAEFTDSKIAVVDADLRRGKVAEYMGFGKNLPGLSEYLGKGLPSKQAMYRNSLENVMFMPRGELVKNPSELVSSSRFRILIAELRERFDYVIIDAPPIMSVADATILGREADGVLMVIRSRKTPKSVIAHSNVLFRQAGLKILGYILTGVEFQSNDYRYYYKYYEQHNEEAQTFKGKMRYALRKLRFVFDHKEKRFNSWWIKKVAAEKAAKDGLQVTTAATQETEAKSGD